MHGSCANVPLGRYVSDEEEEEEVDDDDEDEDFDGEEDDGEEEEENGVEGKNTTLNLHHSSQLVSLANNNPQTKPLPRRKSRPLPLPPTLRRRRTARSSQTEMRKMVKRTMKT